ncbi:LacI family DNA-binding transcriptional regulator [Lactobacillus sp. PSON]|uniref:LacI family DNA-binding transcriptional regulator n=1 Tax=Lactobacillus sp. PSON TaxID=3455454 RepID=UPI004040EDF3
MTTIKEIAEKSGYSSATVSRLLNNDPNLSITADTKNKILELANKLGYWESHQGKKIKPTIALLYRVNHQEQLQDEYFISLKEKIIETTKSQGIKMEVFEDINDLINHASLFQGFLGVGSDEISINSLQKLHKVLSNGVFIDTNPAPNLFDSIKPNLFLTVKDAINQLLKVGYEKIGFIGGLGQKFDHIQEKDIREIAFKEYITTRNIKHAPMYVSGPFSVENGYQLGKLAAKKELPQAFVIASDTLSVGVLQAFNEAGINVPRDVAIISINNSDVAKYVSPPLTSYNINQEEMVLQAISMLTDLIMRPNRPYEEVNVNTNLIVRKSFIPKK